MASVRDGVASKKEGYLPFSQSFRARFSISVAFECCDSAWSDVFDRSHCFDKTGRAEVKLVFRRNTDTGSSDSIALRSRSISFYFHCLGRRRHGILCRKGDYFLFRSLETFPTYSIFRFALCVLFRIKSPGCHFGLCTSLTPISVLILHHSAPSS